MIAVVDYGAGNIASVVKALRHLGQPCDITTDPAVVAAADKLVVPGVGNFRTTESLAAGPLAEAVRGAIEREQKPMLGICVGLQWMFEGSEEAPEVKGLGAFCGCCGRFSDRVKSPHVGWNRLEIDGRSRLLAGIPNGSYVYFTHSYRPPLCPDTVATCIYEAPFTAAAERDQLFGLQFHPEKSGEVGLKILENFCEL